MRKMWLILIPALAVAAQNIPFTDLSRLDPRDVALQATTHKGAVCVRLANLPDRQGNASANLKDVAFHNGTIDVDVAGAPAAGAGEAARGFIGISFRVSSDGSHYENFYIRPTNGRAGDQLRRNHSTQYISSPDWPWERLRNETPGVYESYADMVPGEWTHLKIVVHGTEASLFVGSAPQPVLLVHDLKLGDVSGGVSLWIGPGTEGYFRNVEIRAEP